MRGMYEIGGKGHSAASTRSTRSHIDRLAQATPVSRIMVRQPQVEGERGRLQQRNADDVEPRLRHLGRATSCRRTCT